MQYLALKFSRIITTTLTIIIGTAVSILLNIYVIYVLVRHGTARAKEAIAMIEEKGEEYKRKVLAYCAKAEDHED